jgi:hypothetical protein
MESQEKRVTMAVTMNDGQTLRYTFPHDDERDVDTRQKIERLLQNNSLAIEVDGKLLFIPTVNIKMIELAPAPRDRATSVIHGGREA